MALRFFRHDMETTDGLTVRYIAITPIPTATAPMITATRDCVEVYGLTLLETREDLEVFSAVLNRAMSQFEALAKCVSYRHCKPLPLEGDPWYVLDERRLPIGSTEYEVVRRRELSGEGE